MQCSAIIEDYTPPQAGENVALPRHSTAIFDIMQTRSPGSVENTDGEAIDRAVTSFAFVLYTVFLIEYPCLSLN